MKDYSATTGTAIQEDATEAGPFAYLPLAAITPSPANPRKTFTAVANMLGVDLKPIETEARAAMGFPSDYVLPDNQRTAMHMLGNAVCPPVARDVITAILETA